MDCNSIAIDTVLYGATGTIGDWEDDNEPIQVPLRQKPRMVKRLDVFQMEKTPIKVAMILQSYCSPRRGLPTMQKRLVMVMFIKINEFMPNPWFLQTVRNQ